MSRKLLPTFSIYCNFIRNYSAVKSKGIKMTVGSVTQKKKLPVETDAEKLVNYVCGSNILKEGGEDIKLKPDSEYPDWLWKLNITGKAPPLEECDPNTLYYWRRVRKINRKRNNLAKSLRPF